MENEFEYSRGHCGHLTEKFLNKSSYPELLQLGIVLKFGCRY